MFYEASVNRGVPHSSRRGLRYPSPPLEAKWMIFSWTCAGQWRETHLTATSPSFSHHLESQAGHFSGMRERLFLAGSLFLYHGNDMGDNVACPLNDNGISDLYVFPLHFVPVMKG